MSRKKEIVRREPVLDWKYQSIAVSKFINGLMRKGKKSTAENIFYRAMDLIRERTKGEPLPVFDKAMKNVGPVVHVKSRRVGGSTYQVPVEVRDEQQRAIAIRWIIGAAKGRTEKTMYERLAAELLSASRGEGSAVRRRDEAYRMAEANRAFAHYRW
ncbi:MAG: 30S ribosomal protein S7 [candidate division Zixibacteria bacterium]|nr:30S ribosomal protein S7 [candidate division Zixibacteria bacterium]